MNKHQTLHQEEIISAQKRDSKKNIFVGVLFSLVCTIVLTQASLRTQIRTQETNPTIHVEASRLAQYQNSTMQSVELEEFVFKAKKKVEG